MTPFFERIIALFLIILIFPFFIVLYLLVKLTSKGPFLFTQTRVGLDKKLFTLYKICTMVNNAEKLKKKYLHLNEVDGPVFKIRNDPRYTKFGKFLSHTGLDELPQLINILKGEMSFVGPRPLPPDEAAKLSVKYQRRFSILPGITSPWVVRGSHKLNFREWMDSDLGYIDHSKTFLNNLVISLNTVRIIIKLMLKSLLNVL